MFSQRLIAWLLLVVYGLPSACGPYWHRHDQCEAHILSAQGVLPEDACGCCAHMAERSAPSFAAGGEVSDSRDCDHDACAICRYYATAGALTLFALCLAPHTAVDTAVVLREATPKSAVLAAQPRGPPQQ